MRNGLAPGSGRAPRFRAPWTPQHPRAAPPAGASSGQWADWLFMIGPLSLLGIGLALVLGFTMRIAASAGVAMLVLMWSAVLPPANNPFMDDHIVYALVIVAIALAYAGPTLGLGRAYDRLPLVRR